MKILSENEATVVNMDCEFTDIERVILLEYADKNMSDEVREELMVEWSMIEILKEQVKLGSGDEK